MNTVRVNTDQRNHRTLMVNGLSTSVLKSHSPTTLYLYTSRRFKPIRLNNDDHTDKSNEDRKLYEVRIIDNDYNTYREVMDISILALGIDEELAYSVAWEVDHKGSCVVAHGTKEEAERIASIIRLIGIEVQVNPMNSNFH